MSKRALHENSARSGSGEAGQVLLMAAFMLPLLLGCMGLAIDTATLYLHRRLMQTAADAGAVAGASEIQRNQPARIAESAREGTAENGFLDGTDGAAVVVSHPPTSGFYANHSRYVEVIIRQDAPTYFMRIFGFVSVPIQARAVAGVGARSPNCIYVLDPKVPDALLVNGILTASCGIVVNSSHAEAMVAGGGSCLTATQITITGSYVGGGCAFPPPFTGAPPQPDPLMALDPPASSGCNHTNLVVDARTVTLNPGVYCGGITLDDADVVFNPGLYVLNGGGLTVSGSSIRGQGVTFYNTAGSDFRPITTDGSSRVNLSAPTSGPMEGILFFEDRNVVSTLVNDISAGTSEFGLEGVLYFPATGLVFSDVNRTGATSAYVAIVARTLEVTGSSRLVVNSDYSSLVGGSPIKRLSLVE